MKFIFIIISIILFSSRFTYSQILLIEELKEKAKNIKSYIADFSSLYAENETYKKQKGRIVFKEGFGFRVNTEFIQDDKKRIDIVNFNKGLWIVYNPFKKSANLLDYKKINESIGIGLKKYVNFEDVYDLRWDHLGLSEKEIEFVGETRTDRSKLNVFRANLVTIEYIKDRFEIVHRKIELWVRAEDGLLYRWSVYDKNSNFISDTIYHYSEINPVIQEETFEFTTEEDIKITDITQGWIDAVKGLVLSEE